VLLGQQDQSVRGHRIGYRGDAVEIERDPLVFAGDLHVGQDLAARRGATEHGREIGVDRHAGVRHGRIDLEGLPADPWHTGTVDGVQRPGQAPLGQIAPGRHQVGDQINREDGRGNHIRWMSPGFLTV
jgi:hypothetical protein